MPRLLVPLLLLAACAGPAPASGVRDQDGPSPSPPGGAAAPSLDDLPRDVHRAANRARQSEGLGEVAWRDDLAAVARAHSQDMATRDFFDHVNPDGASPDHRAVAAGIECVIELAQNRRRLGVSENLFMTSRYDHYVETTRGGQTERTYAWYPIAEIAHRTVQSWLDSPGHRRNLLEPTARAEGIGVAVSADDRVFVTQVLC